MVKKVLRGAAWTLLIALCMGVSFAVGWNRSEGRYGTRIYYDLLGKADRIAYSPELTERYRADLTRLKQKGFGTGGTDVNYWSWVNQSPGAPSLTDIAAKNTLYRAYRCEVTLTNLSDESGGHGGFDILSPGIAAFVNDNFFSDPDNHVFANDSQTGTLHVLLPTEGMTNSEVEEVFQNIYITASFGVDQPNAVCHTVFCLGNAPVMEVG